MYNINEARRNFERKILPCWVVIAILAAGLPMKAQAQDVPTEPYDPQQVRVDLDIETLQLPETCRLPMGDSRGVIRLSPSSAPKPTALFFRSDFHGDVTSMPLTCDVEYGAWVCDGVFFEPTDDAVCIEGAGNSASYTGGAPLFEPDNNQFDGNTIPGCGETGYKRVYHDPWYDRCLYRLFNPFIRAFDEQVEQQRNATLLSSGMKQSKK